MVTNDFLLHHVVQGKYSMQDLSTVGELKPFKGDISFKFSQAKKTSFHSSFL